MKKTKNMYVLETQESNLLFEYASNLQKLNTMIKDVILSIVKKCYSENLSYDNAILYFYNVSVVAADFCYKDLNIKFNTQQKYTVAAALLEKHLEEIQKTYSVYVSRLFND